jgi:hypothetical protein
MDCSGKAWAFYGMTLVGRSMGGTREPLYPVAATDIKLLEETLAIFDS